MWGIKVLFFGVFCHHLLCLSLTKGQLTDRDITRGLNKELRNNSVLLEFLEQKYKIDSHEKIKKEIIKNLIKCPVNLDFENILEKNKKSRHAQKCFADNSRYTGTDRKVKSKFNTLDCCIILHCKRMQIKVRHLF